MISQFPIKLKRYNEFIKITTGKSEDYTTGSLIYSYYFLKNYQIICCDLSKQTIFDADPRAIQQIEFYGNLETISQVCTVLKKSKEIVLEFYKGTAKVL